MPQVNLCQLATRDPPTLDPMSNQGPRIAVEDWWLRLARNLVKSYPDGLVVLGRELAKEVGRVRPWSHSTLSNFANKKIGATRELQDAICQKFRLPPPILFPRTYAEAAQMLGVKERHDRLIADGEVEANDEPPPPPAPVHQLKPRDRRETGESRAPHTNAPHVRQPRSSRR